MEIIKEMFTRDDSGFMVKKLNTKREEVRNNNKHEYFATQT